ncbi:hypothetical protein [Bacillus phage CP-51]|uniref:DUF7349 domain-containing protein n=1 Tax=Bacillus phage CP-51 TaxID=1391188 RepID=A0A068EMN1_9CAUD|nr:hypothetical protein OZ73_gp020 [Bacillus phage CP-51]AID50455.1 hypothetical protein [Bacillus phage CP-51]
MVKVQNVLLRGQEVVLATGVVQFDEHGIAEIESEEVANGVLELKNFFAVEEEAKEEVKEEAKEEEKPKAKASAKTTAKK